MRKALSEDPHSGFFGIDADAVPEGDDGEQESSFSPSFAGDSSGVFGSVRPHASTLKAIADHMERIGIKDAIPADKLHATILYSQSVPSGLKARPEVIYPAKVIGEPEVMGKEPWKALVIHLDSASLKGRHDELISAGGTHSYPSFKAHISLKYGPTEMDLQTLKSNPLPISEMLFTGEKFEPLKG